jgi:hypothetical protein
MTMRVDEISALADRLLARAESMLLRDQPDMQADMRLAARLLAYLLQTGLIYFPITLD